MSTRGRHEVSSACAIEADDDVGDAQDIGGHGGDLDAAIAASRQRAETKSTQELQLELEAARLRLVRRSQIIDALRKAYMRDVIIIKNELARKADISEEEYIASGGPGTDITDAIPSLDMRPVLALFSPEDAFLRFESCAGCGGHLEIVTKETKRVARLTKRISGLVAQAEESKKVTAQLRAELTLTRQKVNELDERIVVNRDTLVAQLERTRHQCDDTISTLREDTRRAERAWQLRISQKDVELAAIPVLKARVNAQDQELKEEVSGREQDNHLRDGEIATLKAKVEDLENSGQETNKLLLRERSTCEEIRRRLKGEKDDHAATNGLLEEERARYERCRASLEIAQEHLADLNDRYNELRSEVEANAENAEEQAGEASDALASAKQEAKRLRAVLGQNDLAVALEQSNLKVSSLSEELHAARSESREAADALRECQTLNETLKAELDRQKLYPSKSAGGSSMSSAGGLSWHESIASGLGEYVDEDPEERRDRMSSAMLPGSRRFEKGKWAVEKWIGLVRSRKEVEKHNSEVAHLKHLLKLKQGDTDTDQQAFEREIDPNRGTLEDNEEHDFEARLAEAQVVHEQALEALQLELEKCKEDLAALGAEADEMRSKLKQVEKLEKTKKGHSAMTAELKKMKAEIVVDVEVESSMETPSFEGDMGKEEETRLLEDLSNAKDEIKNMKIRQAMVTHELLGTVKGCHGEIEVLRDKLSKMTAERDARVDISTLAATAGKLSGADTEEFVSLKAECKARKKEISRLEQEMQEGSDALKTVLETISKGCMETRRAKLKVWNERDLDRARSIPPLPIPSNARPSSGKRLSAAASKRRQSTRAGAGAASVAATVSGAVAQEKDPKEAELERRRQERAAQAEAKKLREEEDAEELEELHMAFSATETEGLTFAAERLERTQAGIKEQFREVFEELKDALEIHKKYIVRTRVETRESVAKTAALEGEVERLRGLLKGTEEELQGKSAHLHQTETTLRECRNTVAELQRMLAAAKAEASDNLYFKEKNTVLQKQLDHAEIFTRGARTECAKAKWELQEQHATVMELRTWMGSSEAKEAKAKAIEKTLRETTAALERKLRTAEDNYDRLEMQRLARLENLVSTETQICGYGDPDLGLGRENSTQTTFHSPELTLSVLARGNTACPDSIRDTGQVKASDPGVGIVYPAVDGRAAVMNRDIYSPGGGYAAFTETQSFGDVHPGQASLVRPGSLSDTHARGSAGCGRSKTYSESPGDTDADQWGLWNESSLEEEDSRNPRGLTDGSQHHLPRDARSAPNLTAGGVVSESQNDRRPRTSPDQGSGHVSTRNGSGDRRAPKRIHSKWLMQSAMDVSLGDWTDGEMLSPGSSIFGDSWREQSAYSEPSKRYHLDTTHRPTTSPSRIGGTVQHGGAKSEHYYGVMTTTVDNTGNSVGAWSGHPGCVHLPQPRLSGAQHLEQSCGGAMKLHSSSCQHRSGFSDTTGLTVQVPTPKVWGSKQMIAAVAAATEGHPASSRERAATKGGKLIWLSEGGVVQVEDRLSKARSTLRGDLFDAAERAALPLLQ